MGSARIEPVLFKCDPNDHLPAHVHGESSGVTVVVDLLDDGTAVLSSSRKNIKPANAKASDIRKILDAAAANYAALRALWEKHHAKPTE